MELTDTIFNEDNNYMVLITCIPEWMQRETYGYNIYQKQSKHRSDYAI